MNKSADAKFSSPIRIRFTPELAAMIRTKAAEKRAGISEIVRQICEQYFENEFSDTTLINNTLTQMSRKIGCLENKVELTAMIAMELARHQIRHLPEKTFMSDDMAERRFGEFVEACAAGLRGNHRGVLESMILDIYERTGGGD